MTQQEALQALISAAKVAQQRGAYNLEEASAIHQAILVFAAPATTEESPEKSEKKKKS